jgi:hypothetical protein
MKYAVIVAIVYSSLAFSHNAALADELALPKAAPDAPKAAHTYKARPVSRDRKHIHADARHCLDFHTNREIIKCANRYL